MRNLRGFVQRYQLCHPRLQLLVSIQIRSYEFVWLCFQPIYHRLDHRVDNLHHIRLQIHLSEQQILLADLKKTLARLFEQLAHQSLVDAHEIVCPTVQHSPLCYVWRRLDALGKGLEVVHKGLGERGVQLFERRFVVQDFRLQNVVENLVQLLLGMSFVG